MKTEINSAVERHVRSAALRQRYAPRQRPALPSQAETAVESRLRRLTATALDELKVPGAIPSNVILAALIRAREI